jgi:hypothetical protein
LSNGCRPALASHISSAVCWRPFHRAATSEPRDVRRTIPSLRSVFSSSTQPCRTAVDTLVRTARFERRRIAGSSRRSIPAGSTARSRFAHRSNDGTGVSQHLLQYRHVPVHGGPREALMAAAKRQSCVRLYGQQWRKQGGAYLNSDARSIHVSRPERLQIRIGDWAHSERGNNRTALELLSLP